MHWSDILSFVDHMEKSKVQSAPRKGQHHEIKGLPHSKWTSVLLQGNCSMTQGQIRDIMSEVPTKCGNSLKVCTMSALLQRSNIISILAIMHLLSPMVYSQLQRQRQQYVSLVAATLEPLGVGHEIDFNGPYPIRNILTISQTNNQTHCQWTTLLPQRCDRVNHDGNEDEDTSFRRCQITSKKSHTQSVQHWRSFRQLKLLNFLKTRSQTAAFRIRSYVAMLFGVMFTACILHAFQLREHPDMLLFRC